MATDDKKSIIHRKAMDGRDEFDARVMSPSKALRLALAKIAAKMYGMAITVTMVQQVKISNKDIQKEAGEDGLLVLLDGASGARGAAKLDFQFLTALIEMQTTGKVRQIEAEERPVTRTDAAIAAPLLDAVFMRFDDQLAENDPHFKPLEFRFGDKMEDARALSLALEEPEFDLYRLTLDLEDGAKTGQLVLMLPHRPTMAKPEAPGKPHRASGHQTLEKNAMEAQVVLDAVLAQLKVPLKDVCKFEPGMVLPLGRDCLKKTELTAVDGKVIARVRMGQMNGMRAVLFLSEKDEVAGEDETGTDTEVAQLAKTSARRKTPTQSTRDDVVEGVARPVAADQAAGAPANAQPRTEPGITSAPSADASDAPAVVADSDELSPEDLMKAAQSLQDSARASHEDA